MLLHEPVAVVRSLLFPFAAVALVACGAPSPLAPHPITIAVEPPAPTASAAPAEEPPLRPKSAAELAALEQLAREADTLYFADRFDEARRRFERLWEQHHPNPLALVMAGHAARHAHDEAGAEALFERARGEARKDGAIDCSRGGGFGLGRFDGPNAAWALDDDAWLRLDVRDRRVLYGFCGDATRDPASKAHAPVTWMPPLLGARFQHPEPRRPGEASVGTAVEIFDLVYGGVLGTVPHTVEHSDFNEEHHGSLAFSGDRALLASGANGPDRELRLWRVADRTLLRALPLSHPEGLALSPDGSRLAVASCADITVWDTTTGKRISKVDYRYISCRYGSGIGSSVFGMAFSPDDSLLAVSLLPMGTLQRPAPASEGGEQVAVFRTRDGRRVSRWEGEIFGLRFSPDGTRLAGYTRVGESLVLHDVKGGTRAALEGAGSPVAFSPDGSVLITGHGLLSLANAAKPTSIMDDSAPSDLEQLGPYWIPGHTSR
ncbi:WD-repeat protein [Minicystis rosea]|nr:WD-repeat protein [Minicystis rosea]